MEHSEDPVRYRNGEFLYSANAFSVSGFGLSWGHTRYYSNQLVRGNSPSSSDEVGQGYNWLVDQFAYISVDSDNSTYVVTMGMNRALFFYKSGSDFVPLYGALNRFSLSLVGSYLTLTEPNGTKWEFRDITSGDDGGRLYRITTAGGQTLTVTANTGKYIQDVERSWNDGSAIHYEQYHYAYTSNRLTSVTLRRKIGISGSWTNIRQESYTYYGSGDSKGNLGDLMLAVQQIPSSSGWSDVGTYYYRYWVDGGDGKGFQHGLKLVVEPEAYARMLAASITPTTATDAVLKTYADYYIEYDSSQRVTKESVAAGSRTHTFAYTNRTGTLPTDFNKWVQKVENTRPDGSKFTVVLNPIGQVILHELSDSGGTQYWRNYFEYDSEARDVLHAHPSAVSAWTFPSNLADDVTVTLRSSDGFIEVTDYGLTTTATDTTLGNAAGYRSADKIKKGSTGSLIKLREYWYYQRAVGTQKVYPMGREVSYRNDDNTGPVQTDYTYTWFTSSLNYEQRVTTLPSISTGQNGSGSSNTRTDRYDLTGNLIWTRDERGFINYQQYDYVTGALSQSIVDVDGAQLALPSGWTTIGGGGLHLITDYACDDLGRTTRTMGPVHPVDLSGISTNVRSVGWTVYRDGIEEIWTAQGYASGTGYTTFTLVNPVSIMKMDEAGRTTEQIQATRGSGVTSSGELLSSDSFAQSSYVRWSLNYYDNSGHLTKTRLYHNIPSSGNGDYYTNYHDTAYTYDAMGRQSLEITAAGTITESVYDVRGQVVETKVGAVSSAPIQPKRSWQNFNEPLDVDYDGDIDEDDAQAVTDWLNNNPSYDPLPEPPSSPPPPPPYVDVSGDGYAVAYDALWIVNWLNAGGDDNRVTIAELEYDGGNDERDGNLTQETRWVDSNSSNNRVTTYLYDWRNRRIAVDGEVDAYTEYQLDNQNRVLVTIRRDTTSSGTVIGKEETCYDDLGRVYQSIQYAVNVSTGALGYGLVDNTWYDAAGNVAKSLPAGSLVFTKMFYDGAGRVTKMFTGYDTSETSYLDVLTVTGDTIFEQSESLYDNASNIIQTTKRRRFHNATGTGELTSPTGSQPKARVSYTANYLDAIDRTVAVANYGTNGGSSFSRSSTIPARSDTVLVSSTEFNIRGEAYRSIDPAGCDNRIVLDNAGRTLKTIQNYDDGDPTTGAPDKDITVEYTYNADGNVRTIRACQQSPANDQVTTFVYGVTTGGGSMLYSRSLLYAEVYPDSADSTDWVKYKYNRQGQVIEKTDQNGNVHSFDFDKLGRQTQDRVTTLASGVDGAVRRIGATYEVRGLLDKITSYDNATVGSGSVVNEVQNAYNTFSQLTSQYQEHGGSVNTSTSPKVQYAYADGSSNQIRSTRVTYPNGRILRYEYTSGADSNLSRVSYMADDSGGSIGTHLVEYTYLGLGSFVQADYTQPDLRMDLMSGSGSDPYDGLDAFDRIVDLQWRDYGNSVDAVRIKHGYDRAGNRLWREDPVAAANSKDFDELYAYDGINRLTDMQRGRLDSGKTGIVSGKLTFEQQWGLDPLGNWPTFKEDSDGNGSWDLNQTRTSNTANEITAISGGSWSVPVYDRNGNMTSMPQPASPTSAYQCKWDAWNRLVKIEELNGSGGWQTLTEYQYDGQTWRTVARTYSGGTLSGTRHYYYSSQWQVLEERLGASPSSASPNRQFVWGLQYIDDLVLRDRDIDGDGSLDERLYALQDPNWNVVALSGTSAIIAERFAYQAYGNPVELSATFTSQADTKDWETTYASYRWEKTPQLNYSRFRYLHNIMGRWASRDPIEYESWTLNLYEYSYSIPISYVDQSGLDPTFIRPPIRTPITYRPTPRTNYSPGVAPHPGSGPQYPFFWNSRAPKWKSQKEEKNPHPLPPAPFPMPMFANNDYYSPGYREELAKCWDRYNKGCWSKMKDPTFKMQQCPFTASSNTFAQVLKVSDDFINANSAALSSFPYVKYKTRFATIVETKKRQIPNPICGLANPDIWHTYILAYTHTGAIKTVTNEIVSIAVCPCCDIKTGKELKYPKPVGTAPGEGQPHFCQDYRKNPRLNIQ